MIVGNNGTELYRSHVTAYLCSTVTMSPSSWQDVDGTFSHLELMSVTDVQTENRPVRPHKQRLHAHNAFYSLKQSC